MIVTEENYEFWMRELDGLFESKEEVDSSIEEITDAIAEYEKTVGEK